MLRNDVWLDTGFETGVENAPSERMMLSVTVSGRRAASQLVGGLTRTATLIEPAATMSAAVRENSCSQVEVYYSCLRVCRSFMGRE